MKYAIAHILEGIRLSRLATIEDLREKIVDKSNTIEATKRNAQLAAQQLRDLAIQFAADVKERGEFYRVQSSVVLPGSGEIMKRTRTQYELDRDFEQLEQLRERKARVELLAETNDTDLELFLRAVQAGGESHLTQNALKGAGYGDVKVSQYIIAHNRERNSVA